MQPTPDNVSLDLVIWVAIASIPFLCSLIYIRRLGLYGLYIFFALWFGTLSAAISSPDHVQFIRDLISLIFWILGPLLIFYIVSQPKNDLPIISLEQLRLVLAVTGAALSVRYLIQQGSSLAVALTTNLRVNLEYLSSEPLVTFAFIYAAKATFQTKRLLPAAGFAILFALASVGLVAVTYRGPLILGFSMFIFAGIVHSLGNIRSAPLRFFAVLVGAVIATYLVYDKIIAVVAKIFSKFESVGTNSKISEFLNVFATNSGIWESFFGNGFGGRGFIEGAGTATGFTHNVVSYAYLKIGYVGVILIVAAIASALLSICAKRRLIWHYLPEILTILYIGMFQGAYKHFGYGLLLGVCLIAGYKMRNPVWNGYRDTEKVSQRTQLSLKEIA